jgi:asparagine synthase (glutamine-hydrolysing)
MCGLCGIYGNGANDLRQAAVRRMVSALAHRGPDGEGVYVDDGIALGHRRLSVVDLSPTGAQPMSLGSSGPTISYNGEVYNFAALRHELEAEGRSFRSRSDTEVILHTYDAWSLGGLQRLEGIFAFGLWDKARRRLVLMRDRLGIKPLFYARALDQLVFGSEIKALFAAGGVDTTIDQQAFSEYLWYGNAYEDRTIYREVRCVPPGHWLIIEEGRLRLERWWRLEEWLDPAQELTDRDDCARKVRVALDAAVARQLVADVPVGIFLSGGVDSSAVAASAMAVQSKPLASYCVAFDFETGVNELPKAREVAAHLGLTHHEMYVRSADIVNVLLALARAHDEPFADAANIPLYLLARELRGVVKVVLQGDGGDEMFAGYRRYAVLRNSAWWRAWPRALTPALRATGRLGARAARMLDAAGASDSAERMALLLTVESLADSPLSLMEGDARASLEGETDPFIAYRRCAERFRLADPVQQMLLTDVSLQLPSQFLAKVDRATMALGMEARVPLLDEKVAELAVRIPSSWKVRGTQKKIVLREALRPRLPVSILDGPKTGFGVPYEHWLRTILYDFARDAILDPRFCQRFGFRRTGVERALVEHRQERREHGFRLWKLLQLALWASCTP